MNTPWKELSTANMYIKTSFAVMVPIIANSHGRPSNVETLKIIFVMKT